MCAWEISRRLAFIKMLKKVKITEDWEIKIGKKNMIRQLKECIPNYNKKAKEWNTSLEVDQDIVHYRKNCRCIFY